MVRKVSNSWQYVGEKDRKAVASDLRKVYSATSREQDQIALNAFGWRSIQRELLETCPERIRQWIADI